ncbi:MAG: 4-alpha-glucanotransferase [Clostridia bacterium]|nr:4-alpha-glucanotransferase [Clostridia bacterium]MDE7328924.1 4-alpha-glucanotransferase [Clostridia bacterium]
MNKKRAGILLPIFSLPSKYSIGSFGKAAYKFVDFLKECNQNFWQVLPLNPTIYGDSPYQSPSAFAGNYYFIDIDMLVKDKLLTRAVADSYAKESKRVDYGYLFSSRLFLLKQAFERFNVFYEDYVAFKDENAFWLDDYALFMSLKEYNNNAPWTHWRDDEKYRKDVQLLYRQYAGSMEFWKFTQYEFFSQYAKLKEYANANGIEIIGDMPFYVAYDSADVWANPNNYLLDEELKPTLVAGVPPDLFSEDGQLWGNPIYNWKRMKRQGFSWWIERLKAAYKLYDIIRIDHFRGFAGYYVVDADAKTAREGEWRKGVGLAFFNELNKRLPHAKIIAEDLGVITSDVRKLLRDTGYPGMKVLQFAFSDENSDYLPKNIQTPNCIVYTGTHDNMTTQQWLSQMSEGEAKLVRKVCKPKSKEDLCVCMIKTAMSTRAARVIIPMADYLGLGEEGRINAPATSSDNWTWRLDDKYNRAQLREKIKQLTSYRHRQRAIPIASANPTEMQK